METTMMSMDMVQMAESVQDTMSQLAMVRCLRGPTA